MSLYTKRAPRFAPINKIGARYGVGVKVFLGADHNGFLLKEKIKKYLKRLKVDFEDLGNKIFDPKDDYPDFAIPVAKKVANKNCRGVLICGSGGGVCIAANKIKGIRAAQAFNSWQVKKMREDDDINVLCLPAWQLKEKETKKMIKTFLQTKFSQKSRHRRRIEKIKKIE